MSTISFQTVMSEFDSMVQEELQNMEKLSGTVREYDTSGESYNIPYFDQLSMKESDFSSGNIPTVDVAQRNVQIVQSNHNLKTTIGYAYQTLFNYDVIQGHVQQHAHALARFNDNMKLKALIASDAEFNVGNNNLITTTDLTVTNLIEGRFKLIDNGCTGDSLSMYTSSKNMPTFFNDSDFKSWDQNSDRPLMKGSIGTFGGVDIRVLSSASIESTLPKTTGPNNYIVDFDSVAVGYNRRPTSKVCVEDDQDRVTILSVATAGSIVTRPEGVCKIITTIK